MENVIVEPIDKIVQHVEEEARMVLPGIQTLFGFQLIAVFNQRFMDLNEMCQVLHFIATLCTAIAVLLVLTPAAYHRQAEPEQISTYLCRLGTLFLTLSLFPLALGSSLDLYVIGHLVVQSEVICVLTGLIGFMAFMTMWFVYPQLARRKLAPSGSSAC
jgi:hypothetical protein